MKHRLKLLNLFFIAPLLMAAETESEPYAIPAFESARDYKEDIPPIIETQHIDTERLFIKTLDCYPATSKFKIDVALRGVLRSTAAFDVESNDLGRNYAMLTARVPLYSSTELDRQRDREYRRRQDVAQNVSDFAKAIENRNYKKRLLTLYESLENRSSVRVEAGVASLTEQVTYLEKVAKTHTDLVDAEASIVTARLKLSAACADEKIKRFNKHLQTLTESAQTGDRRATSQLHN